jgi:hypothetical protein
MIFLTRTHTGNAAAVRISVTSADLRQSRNRGPSGNGGLLPQKGSAPAGSYEGPVRRIRPELVWRGCTTDKIPGPKQFIFDSLTELMKRLAIGNHRFKMVQFGGNGGQGANRREVREELGVDH